MSVREHGSRRSAASAHLPLALVLGLVAVAMVRIGQYHWREGAVLIAGALLTAAVMRAVLPPERAGLIVIRGRGVDVLCYAILGSLVAVVALTIAGGPFDG